MILENMSVLRAPNTHGPPTAQLEAPANLPSKNVKISGNQIQIVKAGPTENSKEKNKKKEPTKDSKENKNKSPGRCPGCGARMIQ